MTLEELKERSNSLQAELHRVNDELTKVNDQIYYTENIESILWTPDIKETYYIPSYMIYAGVYKTETNVRQALTLRPINTFQTKEQSDMMCSCLNLIVPMIKLGIENDDARFITAMMTDDRNFLFKISFQNEDLANKASALYRKYK